MTDHSHEQVEHEHHGLRWHAHASGFDAAWSAAEAAIRPFKDLRLQQEYDGTYTASSSVIRGLTVHGATPTAALEALARRRGPLFKDPERLERAMRLIRMEATEANDVPCRNCEITHPWRDHSDWEREVSES